VTINWKRVIVFGAAGIAMAFCLGAVISYTIAAAANGFVDFRGDVWHPAHLIRAGLSPFPGPHDPVGGATGVYAPPLVLLAGVPLSFLPYWAACAVWALILVGCGLGTLWLLRVRDWRCYVVAMSSAPFLAPIGLGNPTPVVILLVAAAYRWRGNTVRSGLAIGAALAVKPFVLPLLLWRNGRATPRSLVAAVSATIAILAAWAAIDFHGLTAYPHLLSRLSSAQGGHGASLYAVLIQFGSSARVAALTAVAAAVVVLIVGRGSFNAAVLASLLFAPITWNFYFALLYVVVATQSPRFSGRWLIGLCYTPFAFGDPVTGARPIWMNLLGVSAATYICADTAAIRRALRRSAASPLSVRETRRLSRPQRTAARQRLATPDRLRS
jgi:hypothetical protein